MFSMSKNDHFIIWLAPWAGKMNRILRCEWLPEQERWRYLAGLPGAVWILASFFLLCKFIDLDSVSVYKHAKKKKNWVDAQPSWPHAWSITHIHWTICSTLLLVLNTRGTKTLRRYIPIHLSCFSFLLSQHQVCIWRRNPWFQGCQAECIQATSSSVK